MHFAGDTSRITNEQFHALIALKQGHARTLLQGEFENLVDLSDYFEEGDCMDYVLMQDPDTSFYLIDYNGEQIAGLHTCGKDDLFTANGQMPSLELGVHAPINDEIQNGYLAWVLAPCNTPFSAKAMGAETVRFETDKLRCIDGSNGCTRLQLLYQGEAVCGMQVKDNKIETMYTHSDPKFRRKGLATQLLRHVQALFPDVQFSDSLSDDGKLFVASTPLVSPDQSTVCEP